MWSPGQILFVAVGAVNKLNLFVIISSETFQGMGTPIGTCSQCHEGLVLLQVGASLNVTTPLDQGPERLSKHVLPAMLQKMFQRRQDVLASAMTLGSARGRIQASPGHDYQCATMSNICECDGIVKIGLDDRWSGFHSPEGGSITCNVNSFPNEVDPYPLHDKVCICRPQVYTCATEYLVPTAGCKECNMSDVCSCRGLVRMGYGTTWSAWRQSTGHVKCHADTFGGDPIPSQEGKICQCRPDHLAAPAATEFHNDAASDLVLRSILTVTVTYFIAFALLAVARTWNWWHAFPPGIFETILESTGFGCQQYAPILVVIFFLAQKRAEALAKTDHPGDWHLPSHALQIEIMLCAGSFVCVAIFHACGEWASIHGRPQATTRVWRRVTNVFAVIQYVTLCLVLFGIIMMKAPQTVVSISGQPVFEAGTTCVVVLAVSYVLAHVILHFFRNRDAYFYMQGGSFTSFGQEVAKLAATTMNFSPMLSVLLLCAEFSMDWETYDQADPKSEATWGSVCVVSILLQAFLSVITPWLSKAELREAPGGRPDMVSANKRIFVIASAIRWIAMALLYVGVQQICQAVLGLAAEPSMTRMVCSVVVTYFIVYLVLWITITLRSAYAGGFEPAIQAFMLAKDTASFAPMLAVLFLLAFVRAHNMTTVVSGEPGQPQPWSQSCMWVAVGAFIMMLVSCALAPVTAGKSWRSGKAEFSPFMLVLFNVSMVILYVDVICVIVGVFVLTPSTAGG
eukprot:TRINITY_DN67670_c0_g1_i1.p1 TRINITY_DN67670_c0_g1~~TRINITY_DN67670_c0_g1_i1.p1  ORF type:complete len:739 (-),score=99.00 TRINITY_DN67670_c0_g1_i1:68-2284(-)